MPKTGLYQFLIKIFIEPFLPKKKAPKGVDKA